MSNIQLRAAITPAERTELKTLALKAGVSLEQYLARLIRAELHRDGRRSK